MCLGYSVTKQVCASHILDSAAQNACAPWRTLDYKSSAMLYEVLKVQCTYMAQWLSWLERRPVAAEVTSSSLVWVDYADMAQLAEQLICNQQVFGSSPNIGSFFGRFPEWPKGADCKSVAQCFGGSNPPPSSNIHNVCI